MTKIIFKKPGKYYDVEFSGFSNVNTFGGSSASALREYSLSATGKRKWFNLDSVARHRFVSEAVRDLFEAYSVNAEYYPVETDVDYSPFLFVPLATCSVVDVENSRLDTEHFISKYVPVLVSPVFKSVDHEPPLYLDRAVRLILIRDDLAEAIESAKFTGVQLVSEGDERGDLLDW